MRSAAILASALVEVAQVRYSSSGKSVFSRRPNHEVNDFGATGNNASAYARLSTAPKPNVAPDDAWRTS